MTLGPDNYAGQPVEWAGSMAGKVLIGAQIGAVLILCGASVAWGVGAAVAFALMWEAVQFFVFEGSGKDGLRDLAFWLWGCVAWLAVEPTTGALWWAIVAAGAFQVGAWVRGLKL